MHEFVHRVGHDVFMILQPMIQSDEDSTTEIILALFEHFPCMSSCGSASVEGYGNDDYSHRKCQF